MFMKTMVHEWNGNYDACRICGATREQIEDNLAPTCVVKTQRTRCNECSLIRDCTGVPPRCEECRANMMVQVTIYTQKPMKTNADIACEVMNAGFDPKRYLTSKHAWYLKAPPIPGIEPKSFEEIAAWVYKAKWPSPSADVDFKPYFGGGGKMPCETCRGTGEIDETLGGIATSNPHTICPDCKGTGVL